MIVKLVMKSRPVDHIFSLSYPTYLTCCDIRINCPEQYIVFQFYFVTGSPFVIYCTCPNGTGIIYWAVFLCLSQYFTEQFLCLFQYLVFVSVFYWTVFLFVLVFYFCPSFLLSHFICVCPFNLLSIFCVCPSILFRTNFFILLFYLEIFLCFYQLP